MDLKTIERAKAIRIEDELTRRGIFLKGNTERAGPCPVCGGRDRFSINVKKQIWNCRGCKIGGDVIALVKHLDGIGFKHAVERLVGAPEIAPRRPNGRRQSPIFVQSDYAALAARIWQESFNPRGTIAETYLRGRGIELPAGDCWRFIRFHQACPFEQERFPALVSLIRNIETNKPQAIQRTALSPDGTAIKRDGKTLRMTLGPATGGAIKIDPDEHVTLGLCIGEGLETCLSGRQIGFAPIWSLLSDSGIANFPVLPGLDGLTIFLENDDASRNAANECGLRWREAGHDVFTLRPEIGNDLNDEIREAR